MAVLVLKSTERRPRVKPARMAHPPSALARAVSGELALRCSAAATGPRTIPTGNRPTWRPRRPETPPRPRRGLCGPPPSARPSVENSAPQAEGGTQALDQPASRMPVPVRPRKSLGRPMVFLSSVEPASLARRAHVPARLLLNMTADRCPLVRWASIVAQALPKRPPKRSRSALEATPEALPKRPPNGRPNEVGPSRVTLCGPLRSQVHQLCLPLGPSGESPPA